MFEAKERMFTLTFMASIGKSVVAPSLLPLEDNFIQVPRGALHLKISEFIFDVEIIFEKENEKRFQK